MSQPFRYHSCTTPPPPLRSLFRRLAACTGPTTPLSYLPHLLLTTAAYLLLTALLHRHVRRHRPAFATSRAFVLLAAAHNVFLSLSSLYMHGGASLAIARVARADGWASTVCAPGDVAGDVQWWQYVFFLSKLYELADTALLVLRGRRPTLLHVWHHASVVYEVWMWLEDGVVIGVYGMWFNTLVHVVMYAYYAAALLKIPFPGKKMITMCQIVQFVAGFTSLVPYIWLRSRGPCRGGRGLAVSALINATYLLLFLRFFRKTYHTKKE